MDRKLIIAPGEAPVERDLTGPEQAQLNRDRAGSQGRAFLVPFDIAVERLTSVQADLFFIDFDIANRKRQEIARLRGFLSTDGFWRSRFTTAGADPDVILARP